MVYKVHHARSGGVLHGARPGWLMGTLRWLFFAACLFEAHSTTKTGIHIFFNFLGATS
jgi:hypothetical protein